MERRTLIDAQDRIKREYEMVLSQMPKASTATLDLLLSRLDALDTAEDIIRALTHETGDPGPI